jgi:hypothetical protein
MRGFAYPPGAFADGYNDARGYAPRNAVRLIELIGAR